MLKRLFIGIPVPKSVQASFESYTQAITSDTIRFVKPENYHITVSFFGEQDEAKIEEIGRAIQEVTNTISPFRLEFNKVTLAPPKKPASMIWAQYQTNQVFTEFVATIEKTLRGIIEFKDQRDGNAPIPHITLARFKNATISSLPQITLDPIEVTTVSLFESKLANNGPIYTELEQFPLSEA